MSPRPPNESIGALEEVLGLEPTREVVRLFLTEFPASIRQLAAAASPEQLRLVHGMKSSARHMGAERLCARMADLEGRLIAGGSLGPADLAGAIADFGEAVPALRRYAA